MLSHHSARLGSERPRHVICHHAAASGSVQVMVRSSNQIGELTRTSRSVMPLSTAMGLLLAPRSTALANRVPEETAMPLNPKDSLDAVPDVAAHSVEKASDIVGDAARLVRSDVTEGISGIVRNSVDMGRHTAEKFNQVVTCDGADSDAEA